MRKTEYRANWPLRIASILICFVLITSYLLSGMYAKYSTTAGGGDGARVAKFDVKMTTVAETDVTYINGLTDEDKNSDIKTYDFTVTTDSEVAVAYDIYVKFSNSLPEGVVPTVRIGDKTDIQGIPDATRTVFTFTSADFAFQPGNQTNIHTLNITVNYYDEDNNLRNVDLEDTNVSISVTARQTD